MKPIAPLLAAATLSALLSACATPQQGARTPALVEVGVIAINDFHGALEPPKAAVLVPDSTGQLTPVPAGGAAWLASAVDAIKAVHPNHVVVAAGDLTSASQLSSSLHLDEPAVGVMNRIGLEFNAVGNHEFDRGWQELERLQNGGCARNTKLEPCQHEAFKGAAYKYLSAGTFKADGTTLFPATGLKSLGKGTRKVTLGFVGLSLKDVPLLVSPSALTGLTFGDEADAINKAIPALKAQGADAVVVLIHQGGKTDLAGPDSCDNLTGAIRPILDKLQPGVDLVVSGHTHWQYVCDYQPASGGAPILLTSAGVYGKLVTDITLTIDPAANRVTAKKARNVVVQSVAYRSARGDVPNTVALPQFSPRADVADYVAGYVAAASDMIQRPVGKLSGPAAKPSDTSAAGGPLGNLIADAQLAASKDAGAEIAFTNPFGIRAPIDPAPDGSVTFGQIYMTQPFNNDLVTLTLTGAQLKDAIEDGIDGADVQAIAPSVGLAYTFDLTRPPRERVVSLTLNGRPIDPAKTYRVTVVQFLADGGDGFVSFTKGTDRVMGMVDNEALQQWIAAVPVREVPQENRTVRVGM